MRQIEQSLKFRWCHNYQNQQKRLNKILKLLKKQKDFVPINLSRNIQNGISKGVGWKLKKVHQGTGLICQNTFDRERNHRWLINCKGILEHDSLIATEYLRQNQKWARIVCKLDPEKTYSHKIQSFLWI